MAKTFVTLTGTKYYFGNEFLKKGMKLNNLCRFWLLFLLIWQELKRQAGYNAVVNEKEVFRDDEKSKKMAA